MMRDEEGPIPATFKSPIQKTYKRENNRDMKIPPINNRNEKDCNGIRETMQTDTIKI